ncbi:MAG: carbohydrate ABC transporter permease [Caldilineaceae bacterium]|nr:carbohydrate ABC transporter permease [Caldilineaceae bacterium]
MRIKATPMERLFYLGNYVFLIVVSLLFLIPFISVLSTSFISTAEWARRGNFVLIPEAPTLEAYQFLFGGSKGTVFNAYKITLFRTIVGTVLCLTFTGLGAYVLARRNLPGRTFMTLLVFIPMVFSGGLIPFYLVVDRLRLTNTVWIMITPFLVNPWWLLIMRNFLMTIPVELEEAALMDGANPLTVLLRVYLPLSMPALTTIGLFYAVWHWNGWFYAAVFNSNRDLYPIQVILRSILYLGDASYRGDLGIMFEPEMMPPAQTLKAAMIIVTTVPILLVYPFIQRYFVKGLLIGGVKG